MREILIRKNISNLKKKILLQIMPSIFDNISCNTVNLMKTDCTNFYDNIKQIKTLIQ